MTTSNADRNDNSREFDYLRVDDFLKTLLDARALASAFELGVIDYVLEKQKANFDAIVEKANLDPTGARLLVDLLRANNVIEEDNGEIRLTGQFASALPYRDLLEAKIQFANFAASDLIDLFSFLVASPGEFASRARMFRLFDYGRCVDPTPENYEQTERWMRITTALTKYEAQACMKYHDLGGHRRMLDVGGNSGEFALRICKEYPDIHATVFDLPLVCDIGQEHVRDEPEADRITFIKGNALADDLPGGFDLITFKSTLHDWPEGEARRFLAKARDSLEPGGALLIFERAPVEIGERTLPYSLIPFLHFTHFFRSPAVYVEQLEALGFVEVSVQKIHLEMPFFLVSAVKGT